MSVYIQGSFVPSWREFVNRTNAMEADFERQLRNERQRARQDAEVQARREAERVRQQINSRIDSAISGVNQNIRRIDEENRRRMRRLSDEVFEAVGDLRQDLERGLKHVNNRIDFVNERINTVVDQVNSRFDAQDSRMDNIESNVRGLYDYISDRQQRGRQAAEDARTMAREYMSKYPIRKYVPDAAQDIDNALRNLPTIPEDAIAPALQIIISLQNAARRAVALEAAHLKMKEYTDAVIESVLKVVNDNRSFSYNDNGEPVDIESDFWSRGRYSEILNEIQRLKSEMNGDPDNERLQQICVKARALDEEAGALRKAAIKKAMESEERIALAENLVSAYIRQGYQVKLNPRTHHDEIGYMGGDEESDWREGVYAIVQGPVGEEITVMVNPVEGSDGNQILFHRNDTRPITEREYIESIRRICDITRKAGYDVGDVKALANCDGKRMPELSDGSNISKKGTAKKVRGI